MNDTPDLAQQTGCEVGWQAETTDKGEDGIEEKLGVW